MQEIDFQDLLFEAWDKFRANWKKLCMASFLGFFLPFFVYFCYLIYFVFDMQGNLNNHQQPDFTSMIILFVIVGVFLIMAMIFSVGTENYTMKICRGETPETKDFFLPFKTYLRLMAAGFLIFLAIYIGILLCVIPGLILMFFLAFTTYAIIDHPELGVIECMKHSWRLIIKNWKPTLILFVINYAISSVIGGTIIGLIPYEPFSILLCSLLYTKFNDEAAVESQPQPQLTSTF